MSCDPNKAIFGPLADQIRLVTNQQRIGRTVLNFDGTSGTHVDAGNVLNLNATPFTIEAWVYPRETGRQQGIVSKRGSSGGYTLSFSTTNDFFLALDNGTTTGIVSSSVPLVLNEWTHVAATFDNVNTIILYLNGIQISTGTVTVLPSAPTAPLLIGDDQTGVREFNGLIDDVRIWNDVRTATEIIDNIHITLIGNESNLQGYWRFDEGLGTVAADSTANAFNGTLVGGVSWDGFVGLAISGQNDPLITVQINKAFSGTSLITSNGNLVIHGFDGAGSGDTSVDGKVVFNATLVAIARNQSATNKTIATSQQDKGYVVFDSAKTLPFTVNAVTVNIVFARKIAGVWEYDNGAGWTTFTPTAAMIVIGTIVTSSPGVVGDAHVFSEPLSLDVVGEAGADVTINNTAKDIVGQGTLAIKNSVDLATADVANKKAIHLTFGTGETVEALKPEEVGANVTETRTASDVLTGPGKAVAEPGADVTADHAADVVVRDTVAPAHKEGRIWIDLSNEDIFRSTNSVWQKFGSQDALRLTNAPAEAGADATPGKGIDVLIDAGGFERARTIALNHAVRRLPASTLNLIINPGFEDGSDFWGVTAGLSAQALFKTISANAHSGNGYLELSKDPATQGNVSVGMVQDDGTTVRWIEVNEGDRVFLDGFIARSGGDGSAQFNVIFSDKDKSSSSQTDTPSHSGVGTSWEQISVQTTVPAGKKFVTVQSQLTAGTINTTYRYDDLSLAVGRAAALTTGGDLQSVVRQDQGNGVFRNILIGRETLSVRDGVTATFAAAYQNVPKIGFAGGLSQDPTLTGKQYQSFVADALNTSSFVPLLRIKSDSGTLSTITETTAVTPGAGEPPNQIKRASASTSFDSQYIFFFTGHSNSAQEPGDITFDLWTKHGAGAFVKRLTITLLFPGTGGTQQSATITDSALVQNDIFGLSIASQNGATFDTFDKVTFQHSTGAGDATATPPNTPDVIATVFAQ